MTKYEHAAVIIVRLLTVMGATAFVLWCLYNLPMYELLQIFLIFFIIPAMFLVALGVIGTETLLGMSQLAVMGKKAVIAIVEEQHNKA